MINEEFQLCFVGVDLTRQVLLVEIKFIDQHVLEEFGFLHQQVKHLTDQDDLDVIFLRTAQLLLLAYDFAFNVFPFKVIHVKLVSKLILILMLFDLFLHFLLLHFLWLIRFLRLSFNVTLPFWNIIFVQVFVDSRCAFNKRVLFELGNIDPSLWITLEKQPKHVHADI